jgi:hypothetical protein
MSSRLLTTTLDRGTDYGVLVFFIIAIICFVSIGVYALTRRKSWGKGANIIPIITFLLVIGCGYLGLSLSQTASFSISSLEDMNNVTITRIDNESISSDVYNINPAKSSDTVIEPVSYTTSDSNVHNDGIIVIRNSRIGLFRGDAKNPQPINAANTISPKKSSANTTKLSSYDIEKNFNERKNITIWKLVLWMAAIICVMGLAAFFVNMVF